MSVIVQETTLEGLASLKPVFDPENGSVTAGNSSQLSDGASVTLVMSEDKAPRVRIKTTCTYFRGPYRQWVVNLMKWAIGPVYSVPKLLKNYNLSMEDIDIWEINEAFAVQVVYCRDKLGIPMEKLNLDGGSISIGHPYGMTGSASGESFGQDDSNQEKQFGVVTMCIGGGMNVDFLKDTLLDHTEKRILECFEHLFTGKSR